VSQTALVVYGGWDGHFPRECAEVCRRALEETGFHVEMSPTLDSFLDPRRLAGLRLILPIWTMGSITPQQAGGILDAVAGGVGLAGFHGGMCDAFRDNTGWQFMTGGQFVAHPGDDGTRHTIHIADPGHPITRGMDDFEVATEMYYMHVDPANHVLATCRFPVADGPHVGNGPVDMPVVWTRLWGRGRVFYVSLGHKPDILELPPVMTMLKRGCAWAAGRPGE
jgi:uncharacterized protein